MGKTFIKKVQDREVVHFYEEDSDSSKTIAINNTFNWEEPKSCPAKKPHSSYQARYKLRLKQEHDVYVFNNGNTFSEETFSICKAFTRKENGDIFCHQTKLHDGNDFLYKGDLFQMNIVFTDYFHNEHHVFMAMLEKNGIEYQNGVKAKIHQGPGRREMPAGLT